MGSVTIKVEGLRELGLAMKDLGFEVQNKLVRQATRAAAGVIREGARANAPVKSGALRASIDIRRDTKASYPGFEVVAVGIFPLKGWGKYVKNKRNQQLGRVGKRYDKDPPTYYWKFVEFGTVKMSAKPFLRPGFDENKSSAAEYMGNTLGKGIDKVTAKYKK